MPLFRTPIGRVAQWYNVSLQPASCSCHALDLQLMGEYLWVNHLLQVSQLGQLSLSSFWGWWVASSNRCPLPRLGWHHLVNAYGMKAWCGWLRRWRACWLELRVQCPLARAMDRLHGAAAPLALANQLPLRDCKVCCSGSLCKLCYIRIRPLPIVLSGPIQCSANINFNCIL